MLLGSYGSSDKLQGIFIQSRPPPGEPFLRDFSEDTASIMAVRREGKILCYRFVMTGSRCECSTCSQQFRLPAYQKRWIFSYVSALSDSEAQEIATKMIRTTRANLQVSLSLYHSAVAFVLGRDF